MTKDQIIQTLLRDNPSSRIDEASMYAGCFLDYQEATDNIEKNGNIVAHPRTGAPIDNPYIKVRNSAMKQLRTFHRLKNTAALWQTDEHG